MEKEKVRLFKPLLSASFMLGTAVYFFAVVYTDGVLAKAGFAFLMIFSFFAGMGIGSVDLSMSAYYRTSTKLAAVMFPLSVNLGSLAAEIFLIKHMDMAALITVLAASLIAMICSVVLVRRYREDDF